MRSLKDLIFFVVFLLLIILVIFGSRYLISYLEGLSDNDREERIAELEADNQRLRSEIDNLLSDNVVIKEYDRISALVHSRYPFNSSGLLSVNVGFSDGIQEDMPVFTLDDIFIGEVASVTKHQSEIKTIFDPSWSSSVSIGDLSVEAIMEGGRDPMLNLIPDSADIEEGDFVYNTSPEYPMNTFFGVVGEVFYKTGDVWKTASIEIPFDIDNLNKVMIYTDFP